MRYLIRRLFQLTLAVILIYCGIILLTSNQGHRVDKDTMEYDRIIAYIKETSNFKSNVKHLRNAGTIMRKSDGKWSVSKPDICIKNNNFVRARLRHPQNGLIFVYSPEIDKHVSASIIRRGHYEGPWVGKVLAHLRKFPNAVFIDIGANIGMFSVTIAAFGHKVVALDCLEDNIMRICASMKAMNLTDNLTIVHNAVSDKHEKVTIQRYDGDVGGTFIKEGTEDGNMTIETVLLDDLLNVFDFKQVVIKMDVEKLEDKVLRGAYKFFEQVRVEALLMEFIKHRYSERGKFIVDFLSKFGLEPEVPTDVKHNYREWKINNIFFTRN